MGLKEVLEFIVNITQNAAKCEANKQALNDHFTFEPYALFSRIDREDKKFITKSDLVYFLNENGIAIDTNRATVDLFIEYYDRDFDNKLNFTEFLNFVLSKDHNLIRSIATQRETYKTANDEFLEKDLEELTVKLLLSEFYLFEYANVKKLEIFNNSKEKIDLLSLFIEMDAGKDGNIDVNDLDTFLSKRKIKICHDELQNFLALFDEDIDEMLNWNEFLFMILPSSATYDYDYNELKMLEGKYKDYYNNAKREKETIKRNGVGSTIGTTLTYEASNPLGASSAMNNFAGSTSHIEPGSALSRVDLGPPHQEEGRTYVFNSNSQEGNYNSAFASLADLLSQIIEFETQIEGLRIKLVTNPNFDLESLFRYFDKYKNDYISFMDFAETLESFDIISKNSILLFSKYDVGSVGRLTKENFFEIFLPVNKDIPIPKGGKRNYNNNNDFELVTKTTIVQLINSLINYFTFFSTLPKWYEKHKDEISFVFNTLDKDKKGYITEDEFNAIFDGKINVEDLLMIMEKIDSDKDGKITYEDMVNLFK